MNVTYAAIIDGMDSKERQAFNRDLYKNPPRHTPGSRASRRVVAGPIPGAELVPLMAAMNMQPAPGA